MIDRPTYAVALLQDPAAAGLWLRCAPVAVSYCGCGSAEA